MPRARWRERLEAQDRARHRHVEGFRRPAVGMVTARSTAGRHRGGRPWASLPEHQRHRAGQVDVVVRRARREATVATVRTLRRPGGQRRSLSAVRVHGQPEQRPGRRRTHLGPKGSDRAVAEQHGAAPGASAERSRGALPGSAAHQHQGQRPGGGGASAGVRSSMRAMAATRWGVDRVDEAAEDAGAGPPDGGAGRGARSNRSGGAAGLGHHVDDLHPASSASASRVGPSIT